MGKRRRGTSIGHNPGNKRFPGLPDDSGHAFAGLHGILHRVGQRTYPDARQKSASCRLNQIEKAGWRSHKLSSAPDNIFQ